MGEDKKKIRDIKMDNKNWRKDLKTWHQYKGEPAIKNEELGKYLENLLEKIYGDLEEKEKENLYKYGRTLKVIKYDR